MFKKLNPKFVKTLSIIAVSLLMMFASCKQANELEPSVSKTTSKDKSMFTSGSQTIYRVSPDILYYFKHYCQTDAAITDNSGPATLDIIKARNACGATSYMMAAYALAKYGDPNTAYSCSKSKLASIVSITLAPTSLGALQSYGNTYDKSFLTVSANATQSSDRSLTYHFIKDALAANKFVIAFVNMYGSSARVNNSNLYVNSSVNPDLDPTSETSSIYMTTKYGAYQKEPNCRGTSLSTTSGVFGHIILIVGLVTNPDGSGVVEYIDPIAQTRPNGASNKRYASFTRVLNSMSVNGCSNNYDVFSVAKKW